MRTRTRRRLIRNAFAFGAGAAVVGVGLIALAFFSGTGGVQANAFTADSLPQGSTPSVSVSPPTGSTVAITFPTVNTLGGTQVTVYAVTRYVAGGGVSGSLTFATACNVAGTTVTCQDTPGSGQWQYTDTPRYAANWMGIESAHSGTATIDTGGPTVSAPTISAAMTYGSNPMYVNEEQLTLTTTATDSVSGVASVAYYYCAGAVSNCSSSNGTFIRSSTSGPSWSATWATPLPADHEYSVVAVATDGVSGTATSSATLIVVDTTAPSLSTPSVNGFS